MKNFVWTITFFCVINIHTNGGEQASRADLVRAVSSNDIALAKRLIESGSDINSRDERGYSILQMAVEHCARENLVNFVRYLIAHGAKPAFTTENGVTTLMIADRVGSKEAADLLKKHGAKNYDLSDMRVKAALTRIDAELLLYLVDQYSVENDGLGSQFVTFAMLKPYCKELPWLVVGTNGNDIFGNPFMFYAGMEPRVFVSMKTVEATKAFVSTDFWKPYLPEGTVRPSERSQETGNKAK
jgi:hypothetical protein